MKYILFITIFLTSIFAQGQMERKSMLDNDKMEIRKKRMEQLNYQKESKMIGIQTSYLNLTPDQAQTFFPMQNEFKQQVRVVQKKYKDKIGKLRSKARDIAKFDVDKAIKYQLEMKQELAKLESEFLKRTTSVLSNEQRAKLVFQQEKMKLDMKKKDGESKKSELSKRNFDRNKN